MGFACSWLEQFLNLLVGQGEVAAKRVDAVKVNAMGTDILRGMGIRLAHGDDATDAGSDATKTVITVKSDSGRTGVVQAGDGFLVRDSLATGWWLGTASADNIISFNTNGVGVDGLLVRGAAPGNYAAPAFIAGLHIVIIPQGSFYIPRHWIDFTDGNVGAVQTDDLIRPGGANLEITLAALETAFAVAHNPATGAHLPNVIDNANLAADALLIEGDENLIDGRFEFDDDDDGLANGWLVYNTPTGLALINTDQRIGAWCEEITTDQPNDGIYTIPRYPHIYQDYLDDDVSFGAFVKPTVDNTVVLEIWDGVTATNVTVGQAGVWNYYPVTHHVAAAATCLYFRIYSTQATVFRVDGAKAKRGRLQAGYTSCISEVVYDISSQSDYENGMLNGHFMDWTNTTNPAAALPPDWWINGANPPAVITQDAANFLFGLYGFGLNLALAQSVIYNFLNPTDYQGQNCYLTGYYVGVAGVDEITITISDGVVPVPTNILPVVGQWKRFVIPYSVNAAAAALSVEVSNLAGGAAVDFVLDGLMWTRGIIPTEFKPAALPKLFKWDFVHVGVIGAGTMMSHGSVLDVFPVPSRCYIHKIRVYSSVAPGGAVVDSYELFQNGAATGLIATVTGANNAGQIHNPVPIVFAPGDRRQINIAPGGGSAAADIGATVEGFRLGY